MASSSLPSFTVPSNLLTPNSQPQHSLHTNYKLLHLLHHRNKNQHRRSVWYRHFNLFRRQVKILCHDLGIDLSVGFKRRRGDSAKRRSGAYKDADKGKRAEARAAIKTTPPTYKQKQEMSRKVSARLDTWVDRKLVERWYTAFTTLLVTPSAAPLALAILGILARVCAVTGVTARIVVVSENENVGIVRPQGLTNVEERVERLAEALSQFEKAEVSAPGLIGSVEAVQTEEGADDLGEFVAREEVRGSLDSTAVAKNLEAASAMETRMSREKKKRKKGNAIDELFAGLS